MRASNTEIITVRCEQRELEYQLIRKAVKNINLRIKPDGRIIVSGNNRVPLCVINDFIRENQQYIIRALDRYEENRRNTPVKPREYVEGEVFTLLGKNLSLCILQGRQESVKADEEFIFLTVKNTEDRRRKENLINKWQKDMQTAVFNQICQETYPLFKKYNIEYPVVKIRLMSSRWGSCQPAKKIITLNSKLIEAPRECIEYVVLHEFAHFIHPNHSPNFYSLVEGVMPDWKERKKKLK